MLLVVLPVSACADVPIDAAHFPDSALRWELSHHDIVIKDGILSDIEIAEIKELILSGVKVLKGIEYLTALESLVCSNMQLPELDLSHFPALKSLACAGNQLTELNLSNNPALEYLYCQDNQLMYIGLSSNPALEQLNCSNNQLAELDLANKPALTTLHCENTQLERLNVTQCPALEYLYCNENQLAELDLSKNTALKYLCCQDNQLTELDLSENVNLESGSWGEQHVSSLAVHEADGVYEVNLRAYVNHINNIDGSRIVGLNGYSSLWVGIAPSPNPIVSHLLPQAKEYVCQLISYDSETGTAVFATPPSMLYYEYKTCSRDYYPMWVYLDDKTPDKADTLDFKVEALERGGLGTDNIICDMNTSHYFSRNGYVIDESYIASRPYSTYGKLGLTADGNSRLILRVQTDKPGYATFTFDEDIGATLESLTYRTELDPTSQLRTSEAGELGYQVSAVLIAPEIFPKDKAFPSDTFKVHVKFYADDGTTKEKDLELKIETAPVILIHGLWGSPVKTFGTEAGPGIWHELKANNFTVGAWEYFGERGPSQVLKRDFNGLYMTLRDMFNQYAQRGIACTRADLVAFGMGGLMVRKFLHKPAGEILEDGNNWSLLSYKQGMVRRVITVAAPHRGTPWADELLAPSHLMSQIDDLISQMGNLVVLKPVKLITSAWLKSARFLERTIEGSGLRELHTDAAFAERDYGFPSDVPMYAICGDARGHEWVDVMAAGLQIGLEVVSLLGRKYISLIPSAVPFSSPTAKNILWTTDWLANIMISYLPVGAAFSAAAKAESVIKIFYTVSELCIKLMADVIFWGEGHDSIVSHTSATGDFGENSTIFAYDDDDIVDSIMGYGAYSHWAIGKQDDVGHLIALLLQGNVYRFKTFGASTNSSAPSLNQAGQEPSLTESDSEEFRFIEALKLNIAPAVFTVSENTEQTVTFSVTPEQPTSYDIYCVVTGEDCCKMFRMPSDDQTGLNFSAQIVFASQDVGVMDVFCFSHNPEDTDGTSILVSNKVQIGAKIDTNNMNFTALGFPGSSGTIYINVSSDIAAELFATAEDGNIYDVSSGLMGTNWTVDDPEIAFVDYDGRVQGLKEGTTTLRASFCGLSAVISVDVGEAYEEQEATPTPTPTPTPHTHSHA